MHEMLTTNAKKLLFAECALLSVITAVLVVLFSGKYIFHFEQVTLNVYTNGTSDFSTNVTSLVRSVGTIAIFSLFLGVVTGTAIGLTCSQHNNRPSSMSGTVGYEEQIAKMGLVVIKKTDEGITYTLTDHGRRFLRDYRFLEGTEELSV